MVSYFSVLSTLVLFSAALIVVCVLYAWPGFVKRHGASVLLAASACAAVRLILPLEIPTSLLVRSWTLLGPSLRVLRANPTVVRWVVTVWVVGAAVMVGWDVFVFTLARRRCRSYVVVEDERVRRCAERLNVGCPVLVSTDVEVPYVAGVFHPTIYFPVLELSEDAIELILAHEAEHIRAHDAVVKFFFGIAATVLWWNPLLHFFRRTVNALIEMRCDAKVTEHMDEVGRLAYVTALKDVAAQVVRGRRLPALALDEFHAVGKKTVLQRRAELLLARKGKPPQRVSPAARCVLAALFIASYLVIVQSAVAPEIDKFKEENGIYYLDDFDGSEIGKDKNGSFIVKESNGRYQLIVDYEFSRYLTEAEVASERYNHLPVFEEDKQE